MKKLLILFIIFGLSGCASLPPGTSFSFSYDEETGDYSTGIIIPLPSPKEYSK